MENQNGPTPGNPSPDDPRIPTPVYQVICFEGEEDTTHRPSQTRDPRPVSVEELAKLSPEEITVLLQFEGTEDTTVRPSKSPIYWPSDIPLPRPPEPPKEE